MSSSYRLPKTGQILKQLSIDQRVMQHAMGLHCGAQRDCNALKMRRRRQKRGGCDILNPKTGQQTKADLDTLEQFTPYVSLKETNQDSTSWDSTVDNTANPKGKNSRHLSNLERTAYANI